MVDSSKENRQRKSIRLPGYDYTLPGGYFVTLVSDLRKCLFGEIVLDEMILSPLGVIARECWHEIPAHFPNISLDAFVIMPNHLHGIIFIHDNNPVGAQHAAPLPHNNRPEVYRNMRPGSLGAIVRSYKSAVTRRAGIELNQIKTWQRNYYEHIIRDSADYEKITAYIESNPFKLGD